MWRAAALAWCGAIFVLSSRPTIPIPPPFPGADKIYHAAEFGMLCLLVARSFGRPVPPATRLGFAVLFTFLYGIADEAHQAFVPGRSCDAGDALADFAGALVTALTLAAARCRREPSRRRLPPASTGRKRRRY